MRGTRSDRLPLEEIDSVFHTVQALELAAGAANISLLGLNMRDGLRMKGWLRRRPA